MSENNNFKHNLLEKNDDFFFDIFDLKLGFFHPIIGEKKRFVLGLVIQPYNGQKRLLSKHMKQTIIMSWELEKLQIFYSNSVILL